jgi:translation initiation factor IF-2
MSEHERAHY